MIKKGIVLMIIFFVLGTMVLVGCAGANAVVGISVYNEPNKTTYVVGEELDISGCTISVEYSNKSTKIIAVDESMVAGFDTSTVGTRSVTITYRVSGKVYQTNQEIVTVGKRAVSLVIKSAPQKSSYATGESITLEGIEVEVTYNNGEVDTLGQGAFTHTPAIAAIGNTSVTVKLDNAAIQYPISVSPIMVEGLSIRQYPNKTEYFEGEVFDSTGLILNIVYNNSTTTQIDEDYEVLTYIVTTDLQGAEIKYKDKTIICPITVHRAEVVGYEIISYPNTEYSVGDIIDLTGLVISIEYNNGNKKEAGYNNPAIESLELIAPLDSVTLEDIKVLLHYNYGDNLYYEIEIEITVCEPYIVDFKLGRRMYQTEYNEGENINLSELELFAVYSNGTEVLIIDNEVLDFDVSYPLVAEIGMTTLIFQYKGVSFEYPIPIVVNKSNNG